MRYNFINKCITLILCISIILCCCSSVFALSDGWSNSEVDTMLGMTQDIKNNTAILSNIYTAISTLYNYLYNNSNGIRELLTYIYGHTGSIVSTLDYYIPRQDTYLSNIQQRLIDYFGPVSGDNLSMAQQLYQVRQLIPAVGSQVADVSSKLLTTNQTLGSIDTKFTSANSYLSNISANSISSLSQLSNINNSINSYSDDFDFLNYNFLKYFSKYNTINCSGGSLDGNNFVNSNIISGSNRSVFIFYDITGYTSPDLLSFDISIRSPQSNDINYYDVINRISNIEFSYNNIDYFNIPYYLTYSNHYLHIFIKDIIFRDDIYLKITTSNSFRIYPQDSRASLYNLSNVNELTDILNSINTHLEESTSIVSSDNDVNIEVNIDVDTGNGISGVVSKIKSLYNTGVNLTAFITALNFFDNIAWFSPQNSDIVNTHSYSYTDLYD